MASPHTVGASSGSETEAAQPGSRATDASRLDRRLFRLAGIVVAGALASLLDTTMLSVAVNGLDRQFSVSLAGVQWVTTAYLLAMAAAIPLTGWCVQRFGTKTMWVSVLTVFIAGSALCGLAWSIPSRLAGGRPAGRSRLDVTGLALLSPGLAALVYGLSQAGQGAISPTVAGSLMIGVMLVASFSWHALRARAGALLDLRLLRVRSYAFVAILTFLSGASIFGPMFLLPLYFQRVAHLSAAGAGLMLAPQGVGTALSLPIAGRLTDRVGIRPVVLAGLMVTAVATVPFAEPAAGDPVHFVALLVRGMGLGTAGIAMMAGAYQGLPPAHIPGATGLISVIQRIGGSVGTAVLAVLLQRASAGATAPAAMARAFGDTFWWTVGLAAIALIPAWLLPRTSGHPAADQGD